MSERLDLTKKDNWTIENAAIIANTLNLPFNDDFISLLEAYIEESVKPATVTDFLTTFAIREFNQINFKKKLEEVEV